MTHVPPPPAPDIGAHREQHELLRTIAGLRYGTVEVTLHNGRIVQIERREKIRFNDEPARPPAR